MLTVVLGAFLRGRKAKRRRRNPRTCRQKFNYTGTKKQNAGIYAWFHRSLSAPICCALYYVPKLGMPAWVHMFAVIVNLAIVGCGALFLINNDLKQDQERRKGSLGVKIMVSVSAVGCIVNSTPNCVSSISY